MIYQVTETQILRLNAGLGASASLIAQAINDATAKYDVQLTARRMRYFVAQTFFETQSYTVWEENLNYSSPERLAAVWPSRFTVDPSKVCRGLCLASDYIHSPQSLGAFVYANRNGNGGPETGDGWTFRGRGAIQLTGRANYEKYSQAVYGDDRVVEDPDMVAKYGDAFMAASWFWASRGLQPLADADQFTQVTKVINGSTATVPERLSVLNKVNSILVWGS